MKDFLPNGRWCNWLTEHLARHRECGTGGFIQTAATVIELAATFGLPVIVTAVGHPSWALPSIVITIGPLLLWLGHWSTSPATARSAGR